MRHVSYSKIMDNLLCLTNRCLKVTSKLILPSVSRFKFRPPYKSRALTEITQPHYHNVNRAILCNLLSIFLPSPKKLLKVLMSLNK